MSQVARQHDRPFRNDGSVAGITWSGQVGGDVAALHQAIEAGLLDARLPAALVLPERPVDALLRTVSRAAGWIGLAVAFAAAGAAIL